MATIIMPDEGKRWILRATLEGSTITCRLLTGTGFTTSSIYSNISSAEISAGNGYTQGGMTATAGTPTIGTGNAIVLPTLSYSQSAIGGNITFDSVAITATDATAGDVVLMIAVEPSTETINNGQARPIAFLYQTVGGTYVSQ